MKKSGIPVGKLELSPQKRNQSGRDWSLNGIGMISRRRSGKEPVQGEIGRRRKSSLIGNKSVLFFPKRAR